MSCKQEKKNSTVVKDTEGDTLAIVNKFCGTSCHILPQPALLDIKSWRDKVLPNMGCRLGISTSGYDPYKGMTMEEISEIVKLDVFSDVPKISQKDWNKICQFFLSKAPDSLRISRPLLLPLTDFETYSKGDLVSAPTVTTLFFDSTAQKTLIGTQDGRLKVFDASWNLFNSHKLEGAPIKIEANLEGYIVLTNSYLYPTELKYGSLLRLNSTQGSTVLIHDLHRPVDFMFYGKNNEHLLINEFGLHSGRLSHYVLKANKFQKSSDIINVTGSIKTLYVDLNKDGKNECLVLFAQGMERVVVLNDSNGSWVENTILRFNPVHGVCDLDVKDMNQDGLEDIIITNGDNADFSPIVKPYHGVRIYLNEGNFKFKEHDFLPYPGALLSVIEDFDQDGDEDIATVSFFRGDKNISYPAFILFKHTGSDYSTHTFENANKGKWMNILSADFDRDGDKDILLGSFILDFNMVEGTRDEMKNNSIVLLNNNFKKK